MLFAATVFSQDCPTNPSYAQIAYLTCLKSNEWNFLTNPNFNDALAQLLRDTAPNGSIGQLPADVAAVIAAITSTPNPCDALKPPPCIV